MTDDNDMALVALLKAAEADPSISSELLRKSYAIERRHQFDRDDTRELSMQELKSLLEAMVDQEASA
ncbi:hypothetical protein [Yersinia kristensenii]|uniref:hypothetical protein n=1 Tax=Yersinia kristensenii TaxID=28152 RepID=UPI001C6109CA|nr:hypothetical protein [Yersinia kristensenii]MBW5811524.1 hypothetical protein [Yersinia kristensenii]MBW5828786.1 hypothetical protein [Yersinia kristensenii]